MVVAESTRPAPLPRRGAPAYSSARALVVVVVLVFRTWAILGRRSRLAFALLALLGALVLPTGVLAYFGLAHIKCASRGSVLLRAIPH